MGCVRETPQIKINKQTKNEANTGCVRQSRGIKMKAERDK